MIEAKDIWRRLEKEGIAEMLRRSKQTWSRFNLVEAYKIRLERVPDASFNAFLGEYAIPQSSRYAETMGHNLVLWHATLARHTDNILEYGFFHHEGVFFAPATFGLPFALADGIPAKDQKKPEALVVFACVFDTEVYRCGKHFFPAPHQYRFLGRVGPEVIFAVVTHESVQCVGDTTRADDGLKSVRFVRRGKQWGVPSRNPFHFHRDRFFSTPFEWLNHYIEFVFSRNRALTLFEIFSGIYTNLSPTLALPPDQVVEALCRECRFVQSKGKHALLRYVAS